MSVCIEYDIISAGQIVRAAHSDTSIDDSTYVFLNHFNRGSHLLQFSLELRYDFDLFFVLNDFLLELSVHLMELAYFLSHLFDILDLALDKCILRASAIVQHGCPDRFSSIVKIIIVIVLTGLTASLLLYLIWI